MLQQPFIVFRCIVCGKGFSVYGEILNPVGSEIEWFGCVAVNREGNLVEIIVRKHHGCGTDTVHNKTAVGSVIVDADPMFLLNIID